MTEKIASQDKDSLFDGKERLKKERPELDESFQRFLQDWKQYEKSRLSNKKIKGAKNCSSFSVSFKRDI
jgi:hypothetical protein